MFDPMNPCACPVDDAYQCIRERYDRNGESRDNQYETDDDLCGCECHEDEDTITVEVDL